MDDPSPKSTLRSEAFLIEENSGERQAVPNGWTMRRLCWLKLFFFYLLLGVAVALVLGVLIYGLHCSKNGYKLVEEPPSHYDQPTLQLHPTTIGPITEIVPLEGHFVKNVFPNHAEIVAERLKTVEPAKPIVIIFDLSKEHKENSPGLAPFAECPSLCFLSTDMGYLEHANVVLFSHGAEDRLPLFKGSTAFVYMHSESPANLKASPIPDYATYIASYRRGADFYAPYGMFIPFNESKAIMEDPHKGKTGSDIIYIASNCYTQNDRSDYVERLSRYMKVDSYGKCNGRIISRGSARILLQRSFFYLAFENSNCQEYITEKFWINGLENKIIPVVMGARKEDYEKVAPPNSFIHVDDFESPKELAQYLLQVKNNSTLYNSYFKWHEMGTIKPSNVLCDVCDYFTKHSELRTTSALSNWLNPTGQCEAAKGPLASAIDTSKVKF